MFVLIAFDSLDVTTGNRVLAVVTATVVLSVIAHGITAAPLAARYGRHATTLHADLPEHADAPALRTRSIAGDRARQRATSANPT